MTLEITALDPHDDVGFARWHATYVAAVEDVVGDAAQLWTLPEMRVQLQRPTPDMVRTAYVGSDGVTVVAIGFVAASMLDNLDSASVDLAVAAGHRRRGHGTAMLARLEGELAAAGRTLVTAEVRWPYGLGTDGVGAAGVAFAERHGFRLGLSDVQRRLEGHVAGGLLDELAAEAADHHGDYELRSWVGAVPDEIAQSWLELSNTLTTEAPMGELELEPERVDVAVLREREASVAQQGRTTFNTVALDRSGTVVAYTNLVHGVHDDSGAFQWGTLVHREHRGHRLGLAVKVANHRLFQAERPGVARVVTWNAEVNAHMTRVNDRLGFRPTSRLGEFQKRLA